MSRLRNHWFLCGLSHLNHSFFEGPGTWCCSCLWRLATLISSPRRVTLSSTDFPTIALAAEGAGPAVRSMEEQSEDHHEAASGRYPAGVARGACTRGTEFHNSRERFRGWRCFCRRWLGDLNNGMGTVNFSIGSWVTVTAPGPRHASRPDICGAAGVCGLGLCFEGVAPTLSPYLAVGMAWVWRSKGRL
jgi:hypothetical protein